MIEDESPRLILKSEFFRKVGALGPEQALFPSEDKSVDEIVRQLEAINPIPQPQNNHLPSLFGRWRLVYASSGTVVTRWLATVPAHQESVKIKHVWQTLTAGSPGMVVAENCAIINFLLLGECKVCADGIWTWDNDVKSAKVTFSTFSFQATKPFGQQNWSLPELKIPILEFFRNKVQWNTSYLDRDLRVGRGETGNLFVFQRTESEVV